MIELPADAMAPAAQEGWATLFQLTEANDRDWTLVGGQMVYLLAVQHAVTLARPTLDMDVVVDLRAKPGGLRWLAEWLQARGFTLEGAGAAITGTAPVGHRFVRPATTGPGRVMFDILGPEGVGARASLLTVPPARTVEVPGSNQALERSSLVAVSLAGSPVSPSSGRVRVPTVLGALVAKAAATGIAVRGNPERDWQDAALLLTLIPDPLALADECTPKDRKRLRRLVALHDRGHIGWRALGDDSHRLGSAALAFLLG